MLRRRQRGEAVDLFVFANADQVGPEHDAFFDEVEATFGVELLWAPYRDRITFQATVFTTLMRLLLESLEIKNPALQVVV